jgi:hypothetical protein
MSEDQFAYWLQGAFEIAGLGAISDVQVEIIKAHIALVRLGGDSGFLRSVEGLLAMPDAAAKATAIQAIVAAQFKHVIDPKHPTPHLASWAHHGYPEGMRC